MARYDVVKLVIKKDPNYKDYVVKFYKNDELDNQKSRHIDTLDGAIETMRKMAMREREQGTFVIEDNNYS